MNDELRQLEEELARLAPRPPGGALRARVEKALDPATGPDRVRAGSSLAGKGSSPAFRWGKWGSPLALAAGLLLAVGVYFFGPFRDLQGPTEAPRPAAVHAQLDLPMAADTDDGDPRFRAVRAENALRSRVDEGLVLLDNGLAARRIRLQFVDTVTWQNPRDGAEFEIATPREEIVLVPVHTF